MLKPCPFDTQTIYPFDTQTMSKRLGIERVLPIPDLDWIGYWVPTHTRKTAIFFGYRVSGSNLVGSPDTNAEVSLEIYEGIRGGIVRRPRKPHGS